MDKENVPENDESLPREGLLSGIAIVDIEQGNSQGFSPRNVPESEPARVLQLSQSFFVADTLEDDESMIIPPTQEFLIPSTPPPVETNGKEQNTSNKNDDTTLSNLDETYIEDTEKAAEPEVVDICTQNDMTQDLPELDETQQILVNKAPPADSPKDHEKETQGDDDWDLRFSETQETQELLGSVKMRESKEKEDSALMREVADPPDLAEVDINFNKPQTDEQPKDPAAEEIESDDEIEPSQSCLAECQGDTYSAFRDQLTQISMEPPTAHSTPDNTFNATKTNPEPEITVLPSPIGPIAVADFKESVDGSTTAHSTLDGTLDGGKTNPEISGSEVAEVEPVAEVVSGDEVQSCKEEAQATLVLDSESTEVQPPVLVLDTQQDETVVEACKEDKNKEKKIEIVMDTIDLMSSVDNSVSEIPKEEVETSKVESKVDEPEKEVMEVSHKEDVKDLKEVTARSEEHPETDVSGLSSDDSSMNVKKDTPMFETPQETLSTIMLPPMAPTLSRLSRKQTNQGGRKYGQIPSHYQRREKQKKSAIGDFQDSNSLQKILSPYGIILDHEGLEAMLNLRPSEELKVKRTLEFTVKDHRVCLEQALEIGTPNAISPLSSSCSTLTSGSMADVSCSSSAKSATFSNTHVLDSTQEQKTSTQNSANSFVNIFEAQKKDEPKVELSPIKVSNVKEPVVESGGRRRGGRKAKAVEAPSSKRKVAAKKTVIEEAVPAKRKRGRAPARGKKEVKKEEEDVKVSEAGMSGDARPRKTRKKTEELPAASPARASAAVQEVVLAETSGAAYADSSYGSIIPGVRVMARWKDGYYYPGEVVSQEMEGRWSICFDDNDVRVIPQENLIKVAILERGTSVFAKSQDDFYDPGLVCGHFREGNSVGYEVELDNGVTKRYPRTSVILSTDQAKAITNTRPQTTNTGLTINLANLVDGKRKRKSLQSPDPNPKVKKSPRITRVAKLDKSPRITRVAKFDSNLDSTTESSAVEKKEDTTETEEEAAAKPRFTRKRKAAKAGAIRNPKLFKDYAFLLTKAERKLAPKSSSSDTEQTEDEEMPPFDKDELVNYIITRGGTILETFEDVQKCKKRNIYLLANTYLRTLKYIKCVAAGIPCIKHIWIQDCCYKGEILNLRNYQLPAGKSLISDQIVEWHGKEDVLRNVKISLISSDNDFVTNWAPVLLAAKADFVQKWNLPSSKLGACLYVDVLITDPQCPSDILQSARRRKIPIVSSEWIIQSLIAGERLPYDAHPKFKYNS